MISKLKYNIEQILMSTESRKLRAMLLASTYALGKCTNNHYSGYRMSWEFIDKSKIQDHISDNLAYVVFILDNNNDNNSVVRHIAVHDGISGKLRCFCDYIDTLKVPQLQLGTLYPSNGCKIDMYYNKGVLCLHYLDYNDPDYREPNVEQYIMDKSEILKLRLLADQIEELNFFILE